jgi:hypothetical protein
MSPVSLAVDDCTICGAGLAHDTIACPTCQSRPRTRAIFAVLEYLKLSRATLPLLGFAVTSTEAQALAGVFPKLKSVSLHRKYQRQHDTGVDARDLSRYRDGSFSGHFSSLLFDYFEEHEQAIAEAYRVIAPEGVLITHIASYRLSAEDDAPPQQDGTVLEEQFPAVSVGRGWFVKALERAGFDAIWLSVLDSASGETIDWFVGLKGSKATELGATITKVVRRAPAPGERVITARVGAGFEFGRVSLRLTLPDVPHRAMFGCHRPDTSAGRRVAIIGPRNLYLSDDLGAGWEALQLDGLRDVRPFNVWCKQDGGVLIQGKEDLDDRPAPILVYDRDLALVDIVSPAENPWHGTSGIDERGGTIIYGEYPQNGSRPALRRGDPDPPNTHEFYDSRLLRSIDGGRTWDVVHTARWRDVRHFHTVRADPFEPGVWWASTGDRPAECRVLRSDNDGRSWTNVTGKPSTDLGVVGWEKRWQALYRYTDVVFTPDRLIWGTDDFMGHNRWLDDLSGPVSDRIGSRLCVGTKGERLDVDVVGYIGNPVRSIIDVGPAWLALTQAKRPQLPQPQVVLVSKEDPFASVQIGTIELFSGPTPFTLSRASRAAVDGRFFTYRRNGDAFSAGPFALQWDISFE